MKKKWMAHGIAVLSFVVLMVLGACTIVPDTRTKEEREEEYRQELIRKGSALVTIKNTGNDHYWVVRSWLERYSDVTAYNYGPGRSISAGCSGEYEVRYTINRTGQTLSRKVTEAETRNWMKKTGRVVPGEKVTVNIP
ncbi:MAG: hypothetical protein FWG07_00930 [Treponema sp.]|nr:hypothetical protein [Treponema sp.]